MDKWHGVFAVMFTPFKDDESLDEKALRAHIDFLIEEGRVHGIICTGSTGEFASLSDDERKKVVDITIRQARHRVPVLVGAAANSTSHTIQYSQYAQKAGAEGLMIVHPFYCRPDERELYAHYRAVAASVGIPIMIYNNPYTSGVDMKPELLARLAGVKNIEYVKESSEDIKRIGQIKRLCGDRITIFTGCDNTMFESFLMGAAGWVSGSANIIPRECVELYTLTTSGDLEKARQLYYRMLPLGDMFELEGKFIQYLKAGSALLGRPAGMPRRPLLPPQDKDVRRLKEALGLIV